MGTCPFCRSQTLPGDSICYSCGRVITGTSGMDTRVRGDFDRTSTRRAHLGSSRRKPAKKNEKKAIKKRRNRINQLGLLGLIAFIFLTPDAKEFVLAKWAEAQEYILEAAAPAQVFPLEAEYTVLRTIDLANPSSNQGTLSESIPVPSDVSSNEGGVGSFEYTDGQYIANSMIQEVLNMELRIDNQVISIPMETSPKLEKVNAIVTDSGYLVWWPSMDDGSSQSKCAHGNCIRIEMTLDPGEQESFDFAVTVKSVSHTWWHSTRMDGRLDGKSEGVSVERSGTFSDISERGYDERSGTFGSYKYWYDRNVGSSNHKWAIDGRNSTAPTVTQVAASIDASLPNNLKTNAYAYARATFDWLNSHVPYDVSAPITARSGEHCLVDGMGDCDDQSNAFMSIMRVKDIPTWYVFGALTGPDYTQWEGHAWAYIMLPLSEDWCNSQGIVLETCYVEGAVDVVNRKWLVHTPTAYIDWVEPTPVIANPNAMNVDGYYGGGSMSYGMERMRSFSTEGDPIISGGTWNNKWLEETLG
ncbi:MAG: transglutaminase family protein [Candidatus Poseidoniaceae archaeon]|nr:transglutaminase family protein [Candidatus Poseidoniaceae archaeon]